MSRSFDFMGNRKKFVVLSLCIVIVTFVVTAIFGVELDIEFKGGSIITYSYSGDINRDTFEESVAGLIGENVSVQQSENILSGQKTFVVSLPSTDSLSADDLVAVTSGLWEAYPDNNIQTAAISNVDPVIGREFLWKCVVAVAFAMILVIAYIALRFRKIGGLSAGVMAMIALLHDIVVVFAVFVLFRIPINDNFIAVVLTILGFSLNDTIVIYDRIRENQKLYSGRLATGELVNLSINQSITRSINTAICSMIAMVLVTIIALINNVDSILSFSLPMLFGLVSGAYSTICLAGPLWVLWKERKKNV